MIDLIVITWVYVETRRQEIAKRHPSEMVCLPHLYDHRKSQSKDRYCVSGPRCSWRLVTSRQMRKQAHLFGHCSESYYGMYNVVPDSLDIPIQIRGIRYSHQKASQDIGTKSFDQPSNSSAFFSISAALAFTCFTAPFPRTRRRGGASNSDRSKIFSTALLASAAGTPLTMYLRAILVISVGF